MYMGARRVFFDSRSDPPSFGQYDPFRLAEMLVARVDGRTLHSVHAFRGRPNRHIDPRGHSANVRQSQAWARSGVINHIRELRYLGQSPGPTDGEEKGIDVELAVVMVSLSLRRDIDGVIIASADTDLVPAIEEVQVHSSVHVEVTGWHNGRWGERLHMPGRDVWCHWLDRDDYAAVRDATVY